MHDLPPQGSIDNVFAPRLVAGLHLREFEGMLRLTLPDAIKVLYFKKGEIASAASNAEPDRLANILMREGRLTAEQLDMARARVQAGSSLGKALIEMGFLTPSELLQGARHQVRVIVASCFVASAGTYEMVPGPLPAEVTPLGVNTRRILFDCLVEAGERAGIIREVGSMEAVYRPTGQLDSVLASLKLDFETDRIGQLLDGSATLREISGRTSHDDFTVSKVVLALELLGAAEKVTQAEQEAPVTSRGRTIPIVTETEEERREPAIAEVAVDARGAEIQEEPQAPQSSVATAAAVEEAYFEAGPPAAVAVSRAIDTTPLASGPAEAADAEPPPIPQEELPAFARSTDGTSTEPAGDNEPQWQIDPETGERVHIGPIEMTFDGRIAEAPAESRSFMWILLAAGAITLVVAGALGYVILRREPAVSPAAGTVAASTPAPLETAAPGTAIAVEPPSDGAAVGAPAETAPGPPTPSATPGSPEGSQEIRPAAPAAARETPAPAPAAPPAPKPARPPETRPAAEASGLPTDPRLASGLERLAQGDVPGAAKEFEDSILSQSRNRFSLQLMIACQEETVKAARARAGSSASLFVLPYALKERPCYRVCWGLYNDAESARAALPDIPPALIGETQPLVVPLSRLRSSG
jgi:uncharacterized protein DUF4388